MVNGRWQSFPTPKPAMPTAEDAQQQVRDLEQWLETHNGSDSEISALHEAAEVIGGD